MLPSIFRENLFDTFFGSHPFSVMNDDFFSKPAKSMMKTDVRELEDTYELDIDLPGFRKEDVTIELDGGYLTITAEKKNDKDEKNEKGQYIRRERYSGACSRSFYVGDALEPKDVSAKFEDGILRLSLPKEPAPKAPTEKRIAIA